MTRNCRDPLLLAARPTIGAALLDEVVVIIVGPQQKRYHVHKALLVQNSQYFAKALQGSWKEAQYGAIPLCEMEPPPYHEDEEEWHFIAGIPYSEDASTIQWKIKAYGFGDRFVIPEFRRAMSYEIIEGMQDEMQVLTNMAEAITWASKNISPQRPLLQFLVNKFCDEWSDSGYLNAKPEAQALKILPPEFTARVIRRYRELHDESGLTDDLSSLDSVCLKEACYLEHVSEVEMWGCGKRHVYYDVDCDYWKLHHGPFLFDGELNGAD